MEPLDGCDTLSTVALLTPDVNSVVLLAYAADVVSLLVTEGTLDSFRSVKKLR